MLNKPFKSRLSRLSSKKIEDQVVQEFVLTYTSEDAVQGFLSSLDDAFDLSLRHPFTSDTINWKRIVFEVPVPHLVVKFDALTMNAMLAGISVSRKEVKDGDVFKYDLVFHKWSIISLIFFKRFSFGQSYFNNFSYLLLLKWSGGFFV